MTDGMQPVTGTGSIVGFAHNGHQGNHGYHHNPGISDKDQGYASTVDAGERTRDVLHGQRFSDNVNAQQHTASQVAIEKVGAANELATEKVGAAAVIATERNATVLQVQSERISAEHAAQAERINLAQSLALSDMRLEQQKQACAIEAKIAECCCKLEATAREIESNRIRDDLAQCRAELIATQRGN